MVLQEVHHPLGVSLFQRIHIDIRPGIHVGQIVDVLPTRQPEAVSFFHSRIIRHIYRIMIRTESLYGRIGIVHIQRFCRNQRIQVRLVGRPFLISQKQFVKFRILRMFHQLLHQTMECRLYHLVKHVIHPIVHRYEILRCYFFSGILVGHGHLPAHFFNLHGSVILRLVIYRTITHIIAPVHIPGNDTEVQQIGQTVLDHRIDLII